MTIASVGTLGSALSTANNQATLVLTTTAAAEVGNLVVVIAAVDNDQTTDGASTQLASIADSAGNTWVKAVTFSNTTGGQQNGADVGIFYTQVTTQIPNGGTITITFGNATTADASAMSAWEFTYDFANNNIAIEATNTLANNAAAAGSLTATTANIACLRIRAIASESNSTTVLTPTASWTVMTQAVSGAGTSITEMGVRGEFRISTTTSDASAPTGGAGAVDNASAYVALREIAIVPPPGRAHHPNDYLRQRRRKAAASFAMLAAANLAAPPYVPPAQPTYTAAAQSSGYQRARSVFYQGSSVGPLAPPSGSPAGLTASAGSSGYQTQARRFYQGSARGPLNQPVGPATYNDGVAEPASATDTTASLAVFSSALIEQNLTVLDVLLPSPSTFGIAVTETASAADAVSTGQVIVEAAAATDTVSAKAVYNSDLFEQAFSVLDIVLPLPSTFGVALTEAASATDAPNGAMGAATRVSIGASARSSGFRLSRRLFHVQHTGPLEPIAVTPPFVSAGAGSRGFRPKSLAFVGVSWGFGVPGLVLSQIVEAAAATDTVSAAIAGAPRRASARSVGFQFSKWRYYQGSARGPLRPAPALSTIVETATPTDAVTAAVLLVGSSIVETAAASEVVTSLYTAAGAITEPAAASDSVSGAGVDLAALTEAAAALDSANALAVELAALAEPATAADGVAGVRSTPGAIAEAASASETVAGGPIYPAAVTEAGSAADTAAGLAILRPAVTEAATATDQIATVQFPGVLVLEAAAAADAPSGKVVSVGAASEAASAADIAAAAAIFPRAVAEAVAAADAVSIGSGGISVIVAESAAAQDTIGGLARFVSALTESASAGDAATVPGGFVAAVHETAVASDSLTSAGSTITLSVVEAATATTTQNGTRNFVAYDMSVSEPVNALDLYASATNPLMIADEPADAIDDVDGEIQPPRHIEPSPPRPLPAPAERGMAQARENRAGAARPPNRGKRTN